MPKPPDRYAKVIPLYRSLGQRETEDERFRRLRYPPSGDVVLWVQNGPESTRSRARNWHGRDIAEHEHTAGQAGADCTVCGFPWWPDSVGAG